jgi:hypothetical protein
MHLTKEQLQMFIDAEKNSTNGPLPMTPDEAKDAACAYDRFKAKKHVEQVEQAIFNAREAIQSAMRNRHDHVSWDFLLEENKDTAEYEAMQVVKQDLIDKGWHVYTKQVNSVVNVATVLRWSTRPLSWWQKFKTSP